MIKSVSELVSGDTFYESWDAEQQEIVVVDQIIELGAGQLYIDGYWEHDGSDFSYVYDDYDDVRVRST